MRICVTGGGGFLGTVLCRRLLAHGHQLSVLDRFTWGTQPLASVCSVHPGQVDVYPGDLLDARVLRDALARCEAVIHLAGIVGYPACDADPQEAERTNVEGTRVLCANLGGRALLFASTGSTYGRVEGLATEDLPISPLTRYGRTKAQAEQMVQDVGGVSFRLATLFGLSPRMRWDLLPQDFARTAYDAGEIRLFEPESRRTFLHVEDAADAFRVALGTALGYGAIPGAVYNVGTQHGNRTKREVAELAQAVTGCRLVEVPGRDPDQRDYAVSFQKAMDALPVWARSPVRTLEATMPELVRWAAVWREKQR